MRAETVGLAVAAVVAGGAALTAAVTLGAELAHCYVPWTTFANDTPLCGPSIWGHTFVPFVLLIIATGLVLVWIVGGLGTGFAQLRGARGLRRRLMSATIDHPLSTSPLTDGMRVCVVDVDVPVALTVGLLRPVVIISTWTIEVLDAPELEAVLEHERCHVAERHPMTFAIVRAAGRALPFAPAVQAWCDRVELRAELEADREAIEHIGRRALISALLRMEELPGAHTGAAVGPAGGMLRQRVAVLSGRPLPAAVDRRERWFTLLGTALASVPLVGLIAVAVRLS